MVLLLYFYSGESTVDTFPAGYEMADSIRFQYAIYFLPKHTTDPAAVLKELLVQKYAKLKLVKELPSTPHEMLVGAYMEEKVQEKYAPPDRDDLQEYESGLTAKEERELEKSQEAFVLNFAHPKADVWLALRTANELIEELARRTNGLVWDNETEHVYSPDGWHEKHLDTGAQEIPDVRTQTVVEVYQHGEFARAMSRGMSKFGLPDLVIDGFPWSSGDQMVHVINLFAQSLAEGATLSESRKFKLEIQEIKNAEMRESPLKEVKTPGTGRACLTLRAGIREKGDPENRLIRLSFDEYPGPDDQAKQESMTRALFGWTDPVTYVEHDAEMLEASRKVRAQLPELQKNFNGGLEPGSFIQVKAPFETPDGGREWMWVEVSRWKNGRIKGTLANDPAEIPDMHAGQVVEVKDSEVFDYIKEFADGHREGNTTGAIIEKMERAGKVKTAEPSAGEPFVPSCN